MKSFASLMRARYVSTRSMLVVVLTAAAAFLAGQWTTGSRRVKADSGMSPMVQVEAIRGDSGLTVYYPDTNKLFFYTTPFAGAPNWGCAFSIQLSTPGGNIQRQPCANPGSKF